LKATEIARAVDGRFEGGADPELTGAAPLDRAGPADLALLSSTRYVADAGSTSAGAVLVPTSLADRLPNHVRIIVDDPHFALTQLLPLLYPQIAPTPGVHPTAVLGKGVELGDDFGGQDDALSPAARRGFTLFTGAAGCASCHLIAPDHALFTDHAAHNTGIGYRQAMAPASGTRSLRVAPRETLRFDPGVLGSAAELPPSDLGRYEITLDPDDRWKYKTPSLRNVELTAPYMHDGSLPTLRDVVEYYNGGRVPHELLDARIRPLNLTPDDIHDIVAFLEALTGDNVEALVADAAAARQ
jgi:hypothetical protein